MGDSTLENRFNSQDIMPGQNISKQTNKSNADIYEDLLSKYEDVKSAYDIARKELKENCSEKKGILTGKNRGVSWLRDSAYAMLGLNAIRDFDPVEKTLLMYMNNQKEDGQIPKKMEGSKWRDWLNTVGIKVKPGKIKPCYHAGPVDRGNPAVDPNTLFVMACLDYAKSSGDNEFLRENYEGIKKASDWAIGQCKDNEGLMEEGLGANWSESVKKKGKVLYSNVCFAKALSDISEIAKLLEKHEDSARYSDLENKVKGRINKKFWLDDKGHYADWIDSERHDYFSSDGNVLSIVWDVANEEKARKIQDYVKENKMNDVPMKTNSPSYKKNEVFPLHRIFGMSKYHNGYSWAWLGCADAVAKAKMGRSDEAVEQLKNIAGLINKHGTVSEVYDENGDKLRKTFYKSEDGFSWTAGMFLWAANEVAAKAADGNLYKSRDFAGLYET